MVTWLSKETDEDGIATFYRTYIMFNMSASSRLRDSYRVRVGIDDDKNIVVEPLNKELATRGDIMADSLYSLEERASYCRLSSASLLRQIYERVGIQINNGYKRFHTRFDSSSQSLIIRIQEGEVK